MTCGTCSCFQRYVVYCLTAATRTSIIQAGGGHKKPRLKVVYLAREDRSLQIRAHPGANCHLLLCATRRVCHYLSGRTCRHIYIYICLYMCVHIICVYVYIYREREREICMCIHLVTQTTVRFVWLDTSPQTKTPKERWPEPSNQLYKLVHQL